MPQGRGDALTGVGEGLRRRRCWSYWGWRAGSGPAAGPPSSLRRDLRQRVWRVLSPAAATVRGGLRVGGGFFAGGPYFGPPPFWRPYAPITFVSVGHAATGDRAPAPADRHPGQRPAARRRPARSPRCRRYARPRGEDAALPQDAAKKPAPRPKAGPTGRRSCRPSHLRPNTRDWSRRAARLAGERCRRAAVPAATLLHPDGAGSYFLLAQALIAQGVTTTPARHSSSPDWLRRQTGPRRRSARATCTRTRSNTTNTSAASTRRARPPRRQRPAVPQGAPALVRRRPQGGGRGIPSRALPARGEGGHRAVSGGEAVRRGRACCC